MTKVYIFDNALINGDDFSKALLEQKECADYDACLKWANENYDFNDYSFSFRNLE